MSDEDAMAQVLDPRLQSVSGASALPGMNSKLMQTMNHVPFTFQKRISGAEDAQNQRHRGTLSSSPLLLAHLRREPDVMMPWAIERNPEALGEYHATVSALWDAKNALLDAGVAPQWSLYLLPNSHRVRFYETGTLLNYYWKWVKRLCFDAQREIFDTARRGSGPGARAIPDRRPLCRRSALRHALPRRVDAHLPRGRALLRHPRLARPRVRDAGRTPGDVGQKAIGNRQWAIVKAIRKAKVRS